MTTVAAIKGKMGDIEYFQCTMKTKDVISRTECATEYFSKEDWEEMGVDGQMQREPSKRYLTDIAPYLVRTKQRFFNSIVVLLDSNLAKFKPLEEFPITVGKNEFKSFSQCVDWEKEDMAQSIGFLTIKDTGHMLILDGQHRMLALRTVISKRDELEKVLNKQEDTMDNYVDHGVFDDDISVVFVKLTDKTAQRKLFGDINTYAKSVSQQERIFIAEDNGYYKITQDFVSGNPINSAFVKFVNLKGTSLPDRSTKLTTARHLNEMIEFVAKQGGYKFPKQGMPSESELDKAKSLCRSFLVNFFTKIKPFEKVLKNDASIPEFRDPEDPANQKCALLFKPMPQVALLEAIHFLIKNTDLDEDAIYRKVNNIDWSIKSESQWHGIVMTQDGTILTGKTIQDRLRDMIIYFILGDKFKKLENGDEKYDDLLQRWKDCTNNKNATELQKVITK